MFIMTICEITAHLILLDRFRTRLESEAQFEGCHGGSSCEYYDKNWEVLSTSYSTFMFDIMANINHLCFSVCLERQWAVPVQGQHCVCFEAVLQWKERDPSNNVSISWFSYFLCSYMLFFFKLLFVCLRRPENVLTYKETPRISFYMVISNPKNPTVYIPKGDVEAAIRWERTSFSIKWYKIFQNTCNVFVLIHSEWSTDISSV